MKKYDYDLLVKEKERREKYVREYAKRNKEKLSEYNKNYYNSRKEKLKTDPKYKEYHANYYLANKDKIKESYMQKKSQSNTSSPKPIKEPKMKEGADKEKYEKSRKYYEEHREKIINYNKERYKTINDKETLNFYVICKLVILNSEYKEALIKLASVNKFNNKLHKDSDITIKLPIREFINNGMIMNKANLKLLISRFEDVNDLLIFKYLLFNKIAIDKNIIDYLITGDFMILIKLFNDYSKKYKINNFKICIKDKEDEVIAEIDTLRDVDEAINEKYHRKVYILADEKEHCFKFLTTNSNYQFDSLNKECARNIVVFMKIMKSINLF